MEYKGELSTGVWRMLVNNQVGVGLTWSTVNPLLPSLYPLYEAWLWTRCGADRITSTEKTTGRNGLLLKYLTMPAVSDVVDNDLD